MKKLLFLAPFLLFANDNIINIEFLGLKHISKTSAKEISLLHKGDTVNIEKINKTIKNFYKFGYFKNIEVEFDNGILKYKFIEKPTILKIHYKNVSEDLKKILKDKLKKGMIFSEQKLEEIRNFIIGYYDAKGEFNTVVSFNKEIKNNGIIVDIIVSKGENIVINNFKIYGLKKEKQDDIKDDIINKNRDDDILGWMPFGNSGELKLQGLVSDSQAIKEYYLSKGYLDVKISNPLLTANFDSNRADLEYKISEGNRYKVGKVNFEIDKDGLLDKNIKDDFLLISGLYFNIKRLKKDLALLKNKIADKGYAFVNVYPDIKKHGNIADVTYKIVTGQKVYISDVIIEGNSKTLDRVIRRNVYLTPNSLYSYTDKQDTISALKRSGYFDDVKLEEIRVDNTHMKILIKVKEGLTGSLRAGISYNSYSKFGFNVSVSERNIFGSGQTLSFNFEKSDKTEKYSMNLKNPRVLDSEYSLSTSVFNSDYEGYSYDSQTKGFSLTLGKSLTRHTNAFITYGYETLNLSDIQDTTLLYDKENSIKSYIMPAISFNNTDDYFFPQHGQILSASVECAGIGGDQEFLKNIATAKFFYSLEDKFDIITILKYKFKVGNIVDNGYLPINEKFYLGGNGSVRGYDYGSISPKDSENNSIGGKVMMVNSAEISVPVSVKKKMWLSAFIDNGRIGENSMNIVRSSYGVSFDWITPVGPLNFTWGWAINPKSGDDLRKFEFSIGSSF